MKHILLSLFVIAVAIFLTCGQSQAVEPDEVLKDPVLETRARAITQELRCVVCQNQSIDDSNAPLARDMRILVRERIVGGDTDEQVREFLVARYGNFVLLKPPLQIDTLLLWFSPLLFIIFALMLLRGSFKSMATLPRAPEPLSAAEEQALKKLSEED